MKTTKKSLVVKRYNASDVMRIIGHNSDEIDTILGYKICDAVVHIDDLALTQE